MTHKNKAILKIAVFAVLLLFIFIWSLADFTTALKWSVFISVVFGIVRLHQNIKRRFFDRAMIGRYLLTSIVAGLVGAVISFAAAVTALDIPPSGNSIMALIFMISLGGLVISPLATVIVKSLLTEAEAKDKAEKSL